MVNYLFAQRDRGNENLPSGAINISNLSLKCALRGLIVIAKAIPFWLIRDTCE